MTINEFFEKTYNADVMKFKFGIHFQDTRPRIYCKDGFNMSVQASVCNYCSPRITGNIKYSDAEIGFPSEKETLIIEYAENPRLYMDTIYAYVPCYIIDAVIIKHGGIDKDRTFKNVLED